MNSFKERFLAWFRDLRIKPWFVVGGVFIIEKLITRILYYYAYQVTLIEHGVLSGCMIFFFLHLLVIVLVVPIHDNMAGDPLGISLLRDRYGKSSGLKRFFKQIAALDQLDPLFAFLICRREERGISNRGMVRLFWYIGLTTIYWTAFHLSFLNAIEFLAVRMFDWWYAI